MEFGNKNKKGIILRHILIRYSCSFWKGGSLIGYSRWFQLVLESILGPNEHDAICGILLVKQQQNTITFVRQVFNVVYKAV